jgi:Bacterial Ig domain
MHVIPPLEKIHFITCLAAKQAPVSHSQHMNFPQRVTQRPTPHSGFIGLRFSWLAMVAAALNACGGGGQAGGSADATSADATSRRQALAVVPATGTASVTIEDGGTYALRLRGTPGTFIHVADPDPAVSSDAISTPLKSISLLPGSEIPVSSQLLFSRMPDDPVRSAMPAGCFAVRAGSPVQALFPNAQVRVPVERVVLPGFQGVVGAGSVNSIYPPYLSGFVQLCPVAQPGGGIALETAFNQRLRLTDAGIVAATPESSAAFTASTTWDVVPIRKPGTTQPPTVRLRSVIPASGSAAANAPQWVVEAADADGAVVVADLFDGFNPVARAFFQPYFAGYSSPFLPGPKAHRWFVKVGDQSGATTTSAPADQAAQPPTAPAAYTPAVPIFSVIGQPVGDLSLVAGGVLELRAELPGNTSWTRDVEWLDGDVVLARSAEYNSASYYWSGAIGSHRLSVRAKDIYGKVTTSAPIQVTMLKPAAGTNQPPVVRLTAPGSAATAAEGVVHTLVAEASDPEGFLSHVEFFDGPLLLGAVSQPPFKMPWSGRVGEHAITAVAVDRGYRRTTSVPLKLTVTPGAPPAGPHPNDFDATLAVVSPTVGTYLPEGQPATLAAEVSALRGGSIHHVEFYVMRPDAPTRASATRMQFVGSASTPPYRVTWRPDARGLYTIVARAVSTAARGTSRTAGAVLGENIQISAFGFDQTKLASTVVGPPPGAPTITITSPAAGTATWGGGLALRAWPVGSDGRRDTAATVKFYVNGLLVGTSTAAQGHQVKWWPSNNGMGWTITAVSSAVGRGDVAATPVLLGRMEVGGRGIPSWPSGSVQQAPNVFMLAPLNGQRHAVGSPVILAASVSDVDGGRLKVSFVSDRGVIVDVPPPYRHTIKAGGPGAEGGTRWWAEVTDDTGTTAISPTATITVVPSVVNTPPTVRLQCPASMRITAGTPYVLYADARDADGRVMQVDFFNNGQPMGRSLGETYWTVNGIGSWVGAHRITARATDDRGATTTSAEVLLEVLPTPANGGPVLPNPAQTCSPVN